MTRNTSTSKPLLRERLQPIPLHDTKRYLCDQWRRTRYRIATAPLTGVFFGRSFHPNGTKIYSARVIPFKGAWMEFATDINLVMYAYIDRKKNSPSPRCSVPSGLIRIKRSSTSSIWPTKSPAPAENLEAAIGRKLAARVLKSWTEDFVDRDTGEVVTIARNDIILDATSSSTKRISNRFSTPV